MSMDLTLLFSPLPDELFSEHSGSGAFFKSIRSNSDRMPDIKGAHIAIIGVPEERGSENNKGSAGAPDIVRSKLYHLKKGSGTYNIIDLGNLTPGIDLEETNTRLSEVCKFLLEQNTLPLIIGGTHDLDIGQYSAYEDMEKLISFLNVDAFVDLEEGARYAVSRKHINKILMHEPNYLFSYTHLAHQSYLVDAGLSAILEKLYFEAHRVGMMRQGLEDMEPSIRSADMLSFDITAIRSSDAPGNANAQPFGLSGEEACQICWYAGINEKLSSAGFYEYNPDLDDEHQKTASVVATMIWYFIEGFYHRKDERNFTTNDFLKFSVSMTVEPEVMNFYKSKVTDRWWMEIPNSSRSTIVPCTYSDYELACTGEVPDRYISALSRMI
jgi:formiminoglutamase